MTPSNVYFTTFRTSFRENLLQKLERLIKKAGLFEQVDFQNKYAAIKIHFGEPGNLAYLRPNYSKVLADLIKEHGGKPFLTDCNTLYVGGRKNALDHLDSAYTNGYNPFTTGCHILIADGLKGTDEALVPVDGEYVKEAKIGQAIMDADIFISLNHFKGHESTGFGGAIKNIGMGCGSRAGKMEMHNATSPFILQDKCIGCHACERNCAHGAISFQEKKAFIDENRCGLRALHRRLSCGRCGKPLRRIQRYPEQENRRVHSGCGEGSSPFPHQPRGGRISLLRLPRRKRRAHRPQRRHVRLL